MKTCGVCKKEKDISEFYRQKTSSQGRMSYCKECYKEYHRKYRKNEDYRKYQIEYQMAYRKDRGKEHFDARLLAHYAVRSGQLKRQPCIVCGDEKAEKHHEDYTKPLEVIWLCKTHHCELHKKMKVQSN